MKKFLNLNFVCMMIVISSCMFISSCTKDDETDDETSEVGDDVTSQAGVWLLTQFASDEGSGNIPPSSGIVYRLTLNKNGSFSFYLKDEDGEETEKGTWSYASNRLTLKSETNGTESMKVISWTKKQLVLLIEDEEGDGPVKWIFTKQ